MEAYQKILKLSELVGNEKISFMSSNPDIWNILKFAYDPFKKYYMSAPDIDGMNDNGTDYEMYDLLEQLHNRDITGQNAFEAVSDFLVSCNHDEAELFKLILNKDLRAGVNIRSINAAIPGLIPLTYDGAYKPPIMLLHGFDRKKAKYPCLAAVKKDGVRGLYTDKMLSRQGHHLIGHDHLEAEIDQYGIFTDGEICVPGLEFDDASGRIRDKSPTPESVIWLFDAINIPGTKHERYRWLKYNIKETNHVKVITHYIISSEDELMKFYKWAVSKGEEGIVYYNIDSLYEDKRSYDWMRLVPIKKADCPVVGFYEGKGKLENSLGGIIIDFNGTEVRVGSGFPEKLNKNELNQIVSDYENNILLANNKKVSKGVIYEISENIRKLRKFIWDNKEQYVGVIAEVEFKGITKYGSMRQPRFKRWRWDK